jgi:hypothetical protein
MNSPSPDGAGHAASQSRTGRLLADLTGLPLTEVFVASTAGLGWPLPVRHDPGFDDQVRVYLRVPFYRFEERPGLSTLIFPPYATVTVDWENRQPVEYVDLRYSRPWPMGGSSEPVGVFPHEAAQGPVAAYNAARERLFGCYDDMFDSLLARRPFGRAEEFAGLLRRLMEPSLQPYYRILSPQFCRRFLGPDPGADVTTSPGTTA